MTLSRRQLLLCAAVIPAAAVIPSLPSPRPILYGMDLGGEEFSATAIYQFDGNVWNFMGYLTAPKEKHDNTA